MNVKLPMLPAELDRWLQETDKTLSDRYAQLIGQGPSCCLQCWTAELHTITVRVNLLMAESVLEQVRSNCDFRSPDGERKAERPA